VIHYISGKSLKFGEKIGFVLALIGVTAMMMDPSAHRIIHISSQEEFTADIVNLISACFGSIYFLMNSNNVNEIPLCTMFTFMYSHIFIINAILAKYDDDVEIFSFDTQKGCLGFLNPKVIMMTMLPYGILCSLMGSAGYVLSLVFFPPEVVSNSFLLEPFVA
jgi:drug/metabolite transporter (DMT)-like permease